MQEARKVLKESSGMMQYSKSLDWDQVEEELPDFVAIMNGDVDELSGGSRADVVRVATQAFKRMTGYDGPARVDIDDIGSGIQMDIIGSKEEIAEALATWEESRGGQVSMEEIEEEIEMNARPMSGGMY